MFLLVCVACLAPFGARADDVRDFAKAQLRALQEQSIRSSREYCGLIGRMPDGRLVTGPASRGNQSRCKTKRLPAGAVPVASYHTHGGFMADYDNEVPSLLDLETEMQWSLRGFVATPGGRFWEVDGVRGEVRLICGPACLPWDSRYKDNEALFGRVRSNYSRRDLYRRAGGR